MLDDLFEMALELLLEGAVEGAKSKKVPLPVRVLLAAGLGGLVLGLCGWAFWRGAVCRWSGASFTPTSLPECC